MYSAIDLSKYIIKKCVEDGHPISNLQLQKILFFIQKKWLSIYDFPAFCEPIQAWKFGPVVPSVYNMFCGNGAMAIMGCSSYKNEEMQEDDMLNGIIEEKRELDPWELVEETHAPGGAWDLTYSKGLGNRRTISLDAIRTYG